MEVVDVQPEENLAVVPARRHPADLFVATQAQSIGVDAPSNLNALRIVHRALRGRYLLVIALGLMTAAAAALVAHRVVPLTYRAEGLVQIHYDLPETGDGSDTRPMTMFDTFMQSQKLLVNSNLIADAVSRDPQWIGRDVVDVAGYLSKNMMVEVKPRSEYIEISVRDSDASRAAAATAAVIRAYQDAFKSNGRWDSSGKSILENHIKDLNARIEVLNNEITGIVSRYGNNVEQLESSAAAELAKLETAINQVKLTLAMASDRSASATQPSSSQPAIAVRSAPSLAVPPLTPSTTTQPAFTQVAENDPIEPWSPEDIADHGDARMAHLIDERDKLKNELNQLQQVHGLKEGHQSVIATRAALDQAELAVKTYADRYRRIHAATSQGLGDAGGGAVITAGKSRQMLEENLRGLEQLRSEVDDERKTMGSEALKLRQDQAYLRDLETERTSKQRLMDRLDNQGNLQRLQVLSMGNVPLTPDDKNKHYVMVAGAGLAAGCFPAGILVLLSLLRLRYEDSEELETKLVDAQSILGIIPDLAGHQPEQLEAAAQTVHHIRVLLQSQQGAGSHAYLVTSATAGEGKTSLTLSLALSFAAARLRTLVIDCDLVGRGLSRLIGSGDSEGLHESLLGGKACRPLKDHSSGVYFLPAGKPNKRDACALSAAKLQMLLAWARRHFDVVLVDSGPILGSVEAAVAARLVDSVIFTVARGQSRGTVASATTRLNSFGVGVGGLIFNRARRNDFSRSSYGSSSRASVQSPSTEGSRFSDEVISKLGPLVGAVACGLPSSRN